MLWPIIKLGFSILNIVTLYCHLKDVGKLDPGYKRHPHTKKLVTILAAISIGIGAEALYQILG